MKAVEIQNPEIITALIKNGAKINERDKFGNTALIFAVLQKASPDIISILIDKGADVKIKNNEGKTAFDYAQESEYLKQTNAYWKMNDLIFK